MTWLSRLLPQSPRLPRLAGHNHRTRQAQRRRRMSTVEALEDRTLLSSGNVVTSIAKAPNGAITLTITGDAHSDTYSVTENGASLGDTVTITGKLAGSNITTVNSQLSYTTTLAISDIDIVIPPTDVNGNTNTSANTDTISLTGHGMVQNVVVSEPGYDATNPSPTLNLTVTNVNNSGTLTVADGTPGTYVGGTLNASVTGSQFSALTIDQVGCCQATVTLNNDVVPGAVSVTEGTGNNDSVSATGDMFGATTISQYVDLNPNGNDGSGDNVSFNDTVANPRTGLGGVFSLAVYQYGTGGGQSILVGTTSEVEVASTGFGIIAQQPNATGEMPATATIGANGAITFTPAVPGDVIHIESITTYGRPSSVVGEGPPSISTLQNTTPTAGNDETTIVDSSSVPGNIIVQQGGGNNDFVHISDDAIGTWAQTGPYTITDSYGLLWVSQGNGGGDLVVVDSNGSAPISPPIPPNQYGNVLNQFNNVVIQQGNGGGPFDTTQCAAAVPFDDVVAFEESNVNDYLYIVQNATFTVAVSPIPGSTGDTGQYSFTVPSLAGTPTGYDGTGTGLNLVEIGGNPEGVTYPDGITLVVPAQVIVDGETYVFQGGEQNVSDLGGAMDPSGIDFETATLDIWTGAGGGSVVTAMYTYVDNGSAYGNNYVINGGADGNAFVDEGVNPGVECSPEVSYEFVKATPDPRWANPADITYGTALDGTQLDATANVPGTFTYTPASGTVLSAGAGQTLSVTFTPTDTVDYNNVTTTVQINVTPAPLTITANNESNVYGAPLPELTAAYSGFVNGDTAASLTTLPTLSTTATASSDVAGNPYSISASGAVDPDYSISYVAGTLTVTPAPLTITASNQNKTYGFGGTSAALGTSAFTDSGLLGSDSVSSVMLATNATLSGSSNYNAGTWTITPSAASGSGLSNYTITYDNAPIGLTVAQTALSITGLSGTNKVYDSTTADPITGSASLSGTVTGDTVTLASGTAAFADPNVGTGKTVTFSGYSISGADAGDYALSQPASSSANITAAGLTITASNQSKTYGFGGTGAALGTNAFTDSGLLGSDSVSSVTLATNASLSGSSNYNAGTWTITPSAVHFSTGSSGNYSISYVSGRLTVKPAALTITAINQSRVYGQPNPPLTVYYQGFVNGDTPARLTAPVALSTPAVLASFAGSYPIFVGGAASPNYAIRFVSGTLAIMPPTDPVVLGRIAFVTSLYHDLLLTSPGSADLFSWLQQLNTGRSARQVASAIYQSPAHLAVLHAHHGVGISFAVALQRAEKAQQQAIQNAR